MELTSTFVTLQKFGTSLSRFEIKISIVFTKYYNTARSVHDSGGK